jgi:formylglycine-generating enzyme required for sulfatase activity
MKGIRHANLLPIFGAWQRDGLLIVAMELADGTLLDRLCKARAECQPGIPWDELLQYLRDAARGLDFLNEYRGPVGAVPEALGIQHKDVKPQNLLLVGGTVKVADFGLARLLKHTVTPVSGGLSIPYAAPELLDGRATRWSDQYSLAATYCELRSAILPYEGSPLEIVAAHVTRSADLTMLPEPERPAVARALAKKPEERWPSCRAFVEALAEAHKLLLARPPSDEVSPDVRLRQESEALLARRYREALERTGGRPTPEDRDALARWCAQHAIPAERAGAIVREVLARWERRPRGQEADWQARPAIQPSPAPSDARPARSRREHRPRPWLLAALLPLAGSALAGLVLLAALYRGPNGGRPETSPSSTGAVASAAAAVGCDAGRPAEPGTPAPNRGPGTATEVLRPAATAPKDKVSNPVAGAPGREGPPGQTAGHVEVPRPRLLDCTGAGGVSAAEVRPAQAAWAKYLGREVQETVEIGGGVKMTFVLVPPGKFRMGSPADEKDRSDDETLHAVTLTEPFDLAKTEVTQAQYQALTDWNRSHFRGPDLPVENVSWEDAKEYAVELTGRRKDNYVYRLPTEAEWEYACRRGRPSSQPFGVGDGRALSSREANFDGNFSFGGGLKGLYPKVTSRAGLYLPNALGLLDMHGNVWEWCADRYGPYPPEDATNPAGPGEGPYRVMRGGCWFTRAKSCRAARRAWGEPVLRDNDLGFRLARTLPPAGK